VASGALKDSPMDQVVAPAARQARRAPPQPVALSIADLSAFTKHLRKQWSEHLAADPSVPSHLRLMNMVARAAGHPNVQALKASAAKTSSRASGSALPAHVTPPDTTPAASPMVVKAATQFDEQGRLARWPAKYSVQRLAMWGLWMHFAAKRIYTEREVNDVFKRWHTFGDHVTLRRELINMKLLSRKSDGSAYWKESPRASDEVRALLHELRRRSRGAAT
jgi:hypothetical protein